MGLDLWFKADVARILNSKEQAARRSMQGAELAGYLAALADLRVEFGLDEKAAQYEIRAERWAK